MREKKLDTWNTERIEEEAQGKSAFPVLFRPSLGVLGVCFFVFFSSLRRNMQIPVVTSQTLPDTFVKGAHMWRHLVVLHGALSNSTALLHSLAKNRNMTRP